MINNEEFYSLLQVQKLTGIKSRQYLVKYINEGSLQAIITNEGISRRYAVKGEWIKSFKERYKRGLVKGKKFTVEELKHNLAETLNFCKEHDIKTLEELIKYKEKI
jgi:hypothetical protein